jgi:hypothetical protein
MEHAGSAARVRVHVVCSAQQYVTVLDITVHHSTLRYITVHYVTSQYITVHHMTLQYITVHYGTSQCITVHHMTLHYITVHYGTSHDITVHHMTSRYSVHRCYIQNGTVLLKITDSSLRKDWRS